MVERGQNTRITTQQKMHISTLFWKYLLNIRTLTNIIITKNIIIRVCMTTYKHQKNKKESKSPILAMKVTIVKQ